MPATPSQRELEMKTGICIRRFGVKAPEVLLNKKAHGDTMHM